MNRHTIGLNLQKIAGAAMQASTELCDEAFEADGTYYVPFVLVAAIKDFQLLGSTLHFDLHQPPEEVARLLRMTADHLEGKGPSNHEVVKGVIQ